MSQPSDPAQEDTSQYMKTMLDYLGDREPLAVFEETPAVLRADTEAVPEALLRIPEAPGKWSVLNVVQHLAQVEIGIGFRYRMVLAEDGPPLAAMDQDRWVANLYPDEVTLAEALDDFAAMRAQNLRILKRVKDHQWSRYGLHSERGQETLGTMVRLYAAHDLCHLKQIERIKRSIDN